MRGTQSRLDAAQPAVEWLNPRLNVVNPGLEDFQPKLNAVKPARQPMLPWELGHSRKPSGILPKVERAVPRALEMVCGFRGHLLCHRAVERSIHLPTNVTVLELPPINSAGSAVGSAIASARIFQLSAPPQTKKVRLRLRMSV